MRMTECDNKRMPGGMFVITWVDPEEGGRAGSLYMYIAPKDFLIKIWELTGSAKVSLRYAWVTTQDW